MVFPYYNNHIIIDFPKLPMIFPWILPVAPCFISSVSSSRPGPAAPSSTCTTASRSLGWGMPWKWMVFMEIPWKILLLSMDFTGFYWMFMGFYGFLWMFIDFNWFFMDGLGVSIPVTGKPPHGRNVNGNDFSCSAVRECGWTRWVLHVFLTSSWWLNTAADTSW